MRAPILRLYLLLVVLFAVLVYFTSRWTVFDAAALRDNPKNARAVLEELKIKRGPILADDGQSLARSVPGPGETFGRRYPFGRLFAHAVGYSNAALGQRAGLERSRNEALTGTGDEFGNLLDSLSGKAKVGDTVRTTLDPRAQQVAENALAGRRGAVVALDPRTGAVKVMADNPSFDPSDPRAPGGSELNRATQSNYAPGSTFKVVTAIAAVDTGRFTPNSTLNGNSPQTVSGLPLNNDFNQSFGPITLTNALTHSVNTVFGPLAVTVGKPTMERYMRRLGFYAKPPLD
jgi:penicillin-binding protein A